MGWFGPEPTRTELIRTVLSGFYVRSWYDQQVNDPNCWPVLTTILVIKKKDGVIATTLFFFVSTYLISFLY